MPARRQRDWIPAAYPSRLVRGNTIEGRWDRGMGNAGDEWEIDFPITYVRR